MTPLTIATPAAATVLCYTDHLTGEARAQIAAWSVVVGPSSYTVTRLGGGGVTGYIAVG